MKARVVERSSMQTRLRKWIENGQLVLAYERQVSLATGRVAGAEAIIRWNDPERGIARLPPCRPTSLQRSTATPSVPSSPTLTAFT